jgi:glycosyltransferase involved in cell wall biosynthesis
MNGNVAYDHETARALSLTYVIGSYPGLTKTFIDREIQALRRWGVDLQVLAIRRPPAGTPLSQEQRELQRGVIYLLPVAWRALLLSHLYFLARHPRRFFATLVYLLTRPHPDIQTRAMTALHFSEGVYAAYLLRKRRFRELHAHFVDRAATVALVAGRLLGKPYSVSIHAGADIFVKPVLLREKVLRARHVVTCTRYNKARVEAIVGCDLSDKISHIHHGIELAKYDPAPAAANNPPLILSVGQLAPRKGFAQLLQACARLKNRGYDFTCEIVGEGPQRAELERLIAVLGLEQRVTLCGAQSHEEVIEKYRRATIFALACIETADGDRDGFPNVLAEAMAMRVPVISTNISAIPELLEDGANGLLIESQDLDALTGAIARLLGDAALRGRLASAGRRTILDRFDVERNVQRFAATLWPESFSRDEVSPHVDEALSSAVKWRGHEAGHRN